MRSDYETIERAISYIENHFEEQPELAEIARHVHLSEAHFQRMFRRWAGISPKRFLQFLTAEHARRMLAGSATVLNTSYAVGLSGGGRLHDLMVNVLAATPGEIKDGGAGLIIEYGYHESLFGVAFVAITPRGMCSLAFISGDDRQKPLRELRKRWPRAQLIESADNTRAAAHAAFGNGTQPLLLYLKGTNFQIRVWEALLRVPAGAVVTYEDIATEIGRPTAVRAVGAAIGQNPIAYLIPCHRVLRKSGAFGEYHWGSARKKAMLAREAGATPAFQP